MESISFYWNFFLSAELESLRTFAHTLGRTFSNPRWLFSLFLVFLILQPFEFLIPRRRAQRKLRPQLWIDVFYTVFNTRLMWVLFGTALLDTWVLFSEHGLSHFFGVQDLRIIELDALPMWSRFVLMYLFIDLIEYLKHWLTHRVNFLWEFHKVHHSSQQLDIWNANRFHFGEFLFGSYLAYFAMALIGFPTHEVFAAALLFGLFITRAAEPHATRMREFFESAFEVMLKMASGVLSLLPYGVFCLLVRVVAKTGFSSFTPLLLYMVTVASALIRNSSGRMYQGPTPSFPSPTRRRMRPSSSGFTSR